MSNKNFYTLTQIVYCKYCGKECKNLNSLKQHECRCKQNPNRIINDEYRQKISKSNKLTSLIKKQNKYKPVTQIQKEKKIEEYNKNPKLCLQCGKPLTYQQYKYNQKFFCHKCSNQNKETRPSRTDESRRKTSESMRISLMNGNTTVCNYNKKYKQGWYNGVHCDSSYELVYLIYCLDHNIDIKRCDKIYEYSYKDSKHLYFPDFIINNNTIVEIKGYHNELVDIKTNSVNDMNYKILYKEDLQKEFEYVYQTYNVNDKTIQTLYD